MKESIDLLNYNNQKIAIPGNSGILETLIQLNKNTEKNPHNNCCIICHPHPLHGGTMHNKVVYTVNKAMQEMNIHTIRFNYRGVGLSEGIYDNSIGEVHDCHSIRTWWQKQFPQASFWFAGFSFGAYIASHEATQYGCEKLLTIAPAVHHQNYKKLQFANIPHWLLIQGLNDEIVPANLVLNWIKESTIKPKLATFDNTGHFFHGKLVQLKETICHEFYNS